MHTKSQPQPNFAGSRYVITRRSLLGPALAVAATLAGAGMPSGAQAARRVDALLAVELDQDSLAVEFP